MLRRIIIPLFLLSFVASIAACSDTWHGVKQDTGDNLRTTSDAISN